MADGKLIFILMTFLKQNLTHASLQFLLSV